MDDLTEQEKMNLLVKVMEKLEEELRRENIREVDTSECLHAILRLTKFPITHHMTLSMGLKLFKKGLSLGRAPSIACNTLQILAALSIASLENRTKIKPLLEDALMCSEKFSANDPVLSGVSKLLCAFSVDDSNRPLLVEAPYVECVRRCILNGLAVEAFKESCRTIINVGFSVGNQIAMVEAGMIEAINGAIVRFAVHELAWQEGVRALYNLSYKCLDAKKRIVECGAVGILCDTIRRQGAPENTTLYAAQTLLNIALVSEGYRMTVENMGVLPALHASKTTTNPKLYNKLTELEAVIERTSKGYTYRGDEAPETNMYTKSRTLPLKYVLSGLRKRVKENNLSAEVLYFAPYFVCFLFFFFVTSPGEYEFYALNGVRKEMLAPFPRTSTDHRFMTITRLEHWKTWLSTVAIPRAWKYRATEITPQRYMIGQTMLVGALRIRVQLVKKPSCQVVPELYRDGIPRDCFGAIGSDTEEKRNMFGNLTTYYSCSDFPSATPGTSGYDAYYHCGGHVIEIPFRITMAEAMARANAFLNSTLIANAPLRLLVVEFHTYTPRFDVFVSAKLVTEVVSGNSYIPIQQLRSYRMWTRNNLAQSMYDIFFALFVFFMIARMVREWRRAWKASESFFVYFSDIWNLLDVVNNIVFLVVFASKIIWVFKSHAFGLDIQSYPLQLDVVLGSYSVIRWFNSVNTILMCVKVLKYLAMNSSLGLLTRTLSNCKSGLFAVLVIFIFVVSGFSFGGMGLYGFGVWEYRTFDGSISVLARMMVGEMKQYWNMYAEQRQLTPMYFFGFQVLGRFVYLNFFIGVIADSFGEVSKKTVLPPLEEQIYKAAGDLKFQFSVAALAKRIAFLQRRRTISDIIQQNVIEDAVLKFKRTQQAKSHWAKLRSHVKESQQFERTKRSRFAKLWHSIVDSKSDGHAQAQMLTYQSLKEMIIKADATAAQDGKDIRDTIALLGEVYLRNIWEELIFWFDTAMSTSEQQQRDDERDRIVYATRSVSKQFHDLVDTANTRLKKVESEILRFAERYT